MTIKQQGGIFGRNPTFNDVTVNDITVDTLSSPAVDLQSNGVADFKKYISITDTNVRINMLETDTTDLNAQIKNQAGIFEIKTISDNLASGTTRLQIDHTNGNTTVSTGNLVIGTSGKGIDFSATSGTGTSELFDDYEEGTWTPVVSDASSSGNNASGTFNGYYTKIGNRVLVDCSLTNANTSGMTAGNDLFITGLPFPTANVTGTVIYTGAVVMHSVATSGNSAAGLQDNQNYLRIYETVSGATFDYITVGDLTSGSADIRFSLTYEAA